MTPDDQQRAFDKMDRYIRSYVEAGFLPEAEIVDCVSSLLSDDFDSEEVRPLVSERTKLCLRQHAESALAWPAMTDCDRIDGAFADLESRGVVCRQDFSCCGTCGSGEILDEMDQVRNAGRLVRGYAYYHMQDTESAVEGKGLYLAYGSVDEGELAAVRVGHEICDAIRARGLEVDWDGSWSMRIFVKLEWKRRRTPQCGRTRR